MSESPGPLGRVIAQAGAGARLEFRRAYSVPMAELWSAITEPERLARWIGTWTGEAGAGRTVQFRMLHEGSDCAPEPVLIRDCEPPRRLVVEWPAPAGSDEPPWLVEATLTPTATGSSLLFVQHFERADGVRDAGPGWHWYLDRLASTVEDLPLPPGWDDFYTEQLKASYAP